MTKTSDTLRQTSYNIATPQTIIRSAAECTTNNSSLPDAFFLQHPHEGGPEEFVDS